LSFLVDVNYISHLNGAFGKFTKDSRLHSSHVSLYMTLFHFWNASYFREEFYINRAEVMQLSKIGSTSTYHRCIKQLHHWGYIHYQPSHNPLKGSKVKLFNFGTSTEQVTDKYPSHYRTSSEQPLKGIYKPRQTSKHIRNNGSTGNFKGNTSFELPNKEKPARADRFRDNLKTTEQKDYAEPL
tara:strand:- start:2091 stop:2639 length:549 start_codon:yes stop_codon:yes gene_type:complete